VKGRRRYNEGKGKRDSAGVKHSGRGVKGSMQGANRELNEKERRGRVIEHILVSK